VRNCGETAPQDRVAPRVTVRRPDRCAGLRHAIRRLMLLSAP
jgi:hypothetical protein